ncbi:MAG: SulP family inorganic anion transporter [Planctomycetota bacterium]
MSPSYLKQDFMASIVVFLVALPLCMGIAIASGVPVAAGLITGIVGGIVVGSIAGCPLQVSGPAAGLTVIIIEIVQNYGLETLGIIVLLAGILQLLAGIFKLGQWFRAVSPAVIKGMLAGIGVLIFASQFHVMIDDKPKGNGITNLVTIPQAIVKAIGVPQFHSQASRKFQRAVLMEAGEIHRKQGELQEDVGELFPHVHDPKVEYTEKQKSAAQELLPAIAKRQQALNERLDELVAKLDSIGELLNDEERTAAIQEAATAAQQQSTLAANLLDGSNPRATLAAQDDAVEEITGLLDQLKNHHIAAYLGVLSIGTILIWNFVPAKLKIIPGPLIAVVVATVVAVLLSLPVVYVEIPDKLTDGVNLPSMAVVMDADWGQLIRTALLVAAVASAETLLCATAVDQMQTDTRTNYDRELCAQGVGNTICGILGVLPMTGVIVRSSANIQAGGKTRLSAILHGIWLLIFVAVLGFLLRQIPTACLAAILVYTGFKLFNVKAIRDLAKYGKSEVLIYAATVTMIVCTDLLTGVLTGIALAAGKLLYGFSYLDTDLQVNESDNTAVLHLTGAATFVRLPVVAAELERVPRGAELHIKFQELHYIDHACLELIMTWAKQHESTGGRLIIDWESLHAKFQPAN